MLCLFYYHINSVRIATNLWTMGQQIMQTGDALTLVASRYERLNELGAGAMGVVYRVYDRLTGTGLALKQVKIADSLFDTDPNRATQEDPRLALANEFQTLASLRHPNIITVLDYGFDEDRQPFFTMDLLQEPQTLLDAAEDIPLTHQVKLLVQLLNALAYIHRRGIVHRDLKPNNILVRNQQVHMLDFGLAIQRGAVQERTAGTLAYMAPEVLMGKAPDESADLYAVGLMAYEMFSGHYPFDLNNPTKLIQDILYTPVPVDTLDIAPDLKIVLAQLLARQPVDRYTDASDVIAPLCAAADVPLPQESIAIRESFLQAASFVGRTRELDSLKSALRDLVGEQSGSAYLIGGESGIGKSRLIDEISTRALVDGILVLRGQMTSDGGLAYQLWRDALRRMALMVELDDSDAALLKTVLPDLPDLLGVPVPDLNDTSEIQKRLLLVIEKMFRQALALRPILLVLEDLHWAIESLTVLEHLVSLIHELPLMIVGSYRNDEHADMLDNLPDMQVITLERLGATEIEQLSHSMLGQAGGIDEVIDLIQRETEGNVFFIVEVVRALAEEAGSLSQIGKATLPASVFAGGVQRIVQRRLDSVPESAQHALRLAAVAGRQLDLALLRQALPDMDVDDWLTLCSNAAVFDVQDAQWRFAHDKLREAVLADIIPIEKSILHRAIAEALEEVYAGYLDDYATLLVYHWAQAGDEAKEGAYTARAANAMYERNEYREMKRLYERALELKVYERDDNPRKAYADLISYLGRATYMLSDYDAVQHWREAALEIYRELDDNFGIAESLAALGEVLLRQHKNDEALSLIEQSRDLYESVGKRKKVAYADMNLGIIYSQKDDQKTALQYLERCHAVMREVGEPLDKARALNNLGVINDLMGNLEQAKVYLIEALQIRRAINDRHGIAYSLNNLGAIADLQGDTEEAEKLQLESLQLLRLLGEKMAQSIALNGLADLYVKMERYDDAEVFYTQCMHLRQGFGNISGVAQALNGLGNVARERGENVNAWALYLQALEKAEEAESLPSTRGILYSIGRLLMKQQQFAAAAQVFTFLSQDENARHRDEMQAALKSMAEVLPESTYREAVEAGQNSNLDQLKMLVRSLSSIKDSGNGK